MSIGVGDVWDVWDVWDVRDVWDVWYGMVRFCCKVTGVKMLFVYMCSWWITV